MVNIGQLAREAYGRDRVFSIGFGSYSGEVLAGRVWGGKMERMTLPEARQGSWESLLKSAEHDNFVLLFEDFPEILLSRPFPHRAVGVTYQPESDRVKNYVQTILPGRYDAFVFLSSTKGLHPID